MVEIEALKDKISYIEREEIVNMKKDITDIKLNQVETNTLVKEFTKVMNMQGKAMETMSLSLQEMTYTNKRLVEEMKEVKVEVKQTNQTIKCVEEETQRKFEEMDEKIKEQEEKGKIDILVVIKNNWLKIVVGGYMIWQVVEKVGASL